MSSNAEHRPDRREFVRVVAALGTGGLLAATRGADRPPGRVTAKLGRIGIQLYTVRRELTKDVEGTLARLAEIGFKEVEFAGYPEGTAQSLRAMLDRHGLSAPSSHVGLGSLRRDWARTLDQAAMVGQKFVVVAFVPSDQRRTLDDWKRLAALFNKAGEESRARGLQFGYHNHDFEFTPVEGRIPYDMLLAEADPKLVKLELDLYWITKAGHDALAYFTKWPGRFPLLHVKDMEATPRKFFAPVGKGVIDFARIFKQSTLAGVKHYFYEQDEVSGAPFADAATSFAYLRALTF